MLPTLWIAALALVSTSTVAARCHTDRGIERCDDLLPVASDLGFRILNNEVAGVDAATVTVTGTVASSPEPSATSLSILTIPDAEGVQTSSPSRPRITQAATKSGHSHGAKSASSHSDRRPVSCRPKREEAWNLKLRIASIFVIFITSTFGVLAPMLLSKYTKLNNDGFVFLVIKQFGTGIILSTVYVHLLNHAIVDFGNPCIGELDYEPTPMAVTLAGAFMSFLVDYAGMRFLNSRYPPTRHLLDVHSNPISPIDDNMVLGDDKARVDRFEMAQLAREATSSNAEKKLGVAIMEGGIIFHSIMVGVILTITPDSELRTIFAVVLVHQLFEGLALGARIEPLQAMRDSSKLAMGLAFSVTCPIGMSIGIAVQKSFNVNDRRTIVVLGVMNALSAGVLAWVAFVELWSKDWLHGELRTASTRRTMLALLSLIAGLVLMGVLGKWA